MEEDAFVYSCIEFRTQHEVEGRLIDIFCACLSVGVYGHAASSGTCGRNVTVCKFSVDIST